MMEEKDVYTYTQKIISQVVSDNDKATIETIKRYCEENDIYPNLISEDKLKEVIELGIASKAKTDIIQSQLDTANKQLSNKEAIIKETYHYIAKARLKAQRLMTREHDSEKEKALSDIYDLLVEATNKFDLKDIYTKIF